MRVPAGRVTLSVDVAAPAERVLELRVGSGFGVCGDGSVFNSDYWSRNPKHFKRQQNLVIYLFFDINF